MGSRTSTLRRSVSFVYSRWIASSSVSRATSKSLIARTSTSVRSSPFHSYQLSLDTSTVKLSTLGSVHVKIRFLSCKISSPVAKIKLVLPFSNDLRVSGSRRLFFALAMRFLTQSISTSGRKRRSKRFTAGWRQRMWRMSRSSGGVQQPMKTELCY